MLDDDTAFLLSRGIIGVGAGYCFVLGRPFEDSSDGSPGGREAADACLSCHLELHLLGRRVPPRAPLNERTATADLGLDVIHVLGPRVMDRRPRELSAATVTVDLDRNTAARGRGADTFGSPIGAVAWTARWPSERGRRLEAGDIVTTGRCTGLVSVVPGQRVRAGFEGIGAVTLNLI